MLLGLEVVVKVGELVDRWKYAVLNIFLDSSSEKDINFVVIFFASLTTRRDARPEAALTE